ncbi:hypothetical protein OH491_27910 (plasmid) [Termitidicoccus mucosus]|uniref:hypothetical protein n=1 Tax=Termitidicoccus mucosus TaxID=1184151 RepID=UPI0031844458
MDTLVPKDMLAAEKRLARSYRVGDEIQFISKYGANRAGDLRKIVHITEGALLLEPRRRGQGCAAQPQICREVEHRKPAKTLLGVGSQARKCSSRQRQRQGRWWRTVNGEICTVTRLFRNGGVAIRDGDGNSKSSRRTRWCCSPAIASPPTARKAKALNPWFF